MSVDLSCIRTVLPKDGKWHHIDIEIQYPYRRIYLDGKKVEVDVVKFSDDVYIDEMVFSNPSRRYPSHIIINDNPSRRRSLSLEKQINFPKKRSLTLDVYSEGLDETDVTTLTILAKMDECVAEYYK